MANERTIEPVSRVLTLHWAWKAGGLNKRAYNALRRAHIRHLGELANWSRRDLAMLPNIYMATVLHIESVLRIHGLKLREDTAPISPLSHRR